MRLVAQVGSLRRPDAGPEDGQTDEEGFRVHVRPKVRESQRSQNRHFFERFQREAQSEIRRRRATEADGKTRHGQTAANAGRRKEALWLKPDLVAEVAFRAWADDGKLLYGSFKGLREGEDAADMFELPSSIDS